MIAFVYEIRVLIKHISDIPKSAYKECTKISVEKIYKSRDVLDIELAGHRIIGFLIETFIDAIQNPNDRYSHLLLERVPEQYEVKSEKLYNITIDYVSGMTDVYALDLYRKITGMSLPAV